MKSSKLKEKWLGILRKLENENFQLLVSSENPRLHMINKEVIEIIKEFIEDIGR